MDRILKYRSQLMGIAIIWVLVYHTGLKIHIYFLNFLKGIGWAGVDMFVFLSGLGLYYSLTKSHDLGFYLKKRIHRIMPAYFPVLIYYTIKLNIEPINFIGNVSGLGYFLNRENQLFWYYSFLIISYILAPFFVAFLNKQDCIYDSNEECKVVYNLRNPKIRGGGVCN